MNIRLTFKIMVRILLIGDTFAFSRLNAMVDPFDAASSVEARKESTFSQNNCGEKDISTITWSHCGNT